MSHRYELVGPVLRFHQLGLPVPQGAIRHLGAGRPSVHANAATLKPWRAQIQSAAEETLKVTDTSPWFPPGSFPLAGNPIGLGVYFTMRKPVSAPKTRITYPISRPDVDKLVRAVLDALAAAGVYRDDSQVVWLETKKMFPGEDIHALHVPGVAVEVYDIRSRRATMEPEQGDPPPG